MAKGSRAAKNIFNMSDKQIKAAWLAQEKADAARSAKGALTVAKKAAPSRVSGASGLVEAFAGKAGSDAMKRKFMEQNRRENDKKARTGRGKTTA